MAITRASPLRRVSERTRRVDVDVYKGEGDEGNQILRPQKGDHRNFWGRVSFHVESLREKGSTSRRRRRM
jgi:hypothetical protein